MFCGVESYISPNWYASKAEHGKVVPTWNYEAVHAHGSATVRDDAQWLREFIDRFTDTHESMQPWPWRVSDAPDDYLQKMFSAIVGIEMTVTKLEGKAKLSQNQPKQNLATIAHGLAQANHPDETARSHQKFMASRIKSQ